MMMNMMLAGALCSAAAVLAQQASSNVVPKSAFDGAVWRAMSAPKLPAMSTGRPTIFRNAPASTVCAIPLLEARVPPIHDRIVRFNESSSIDPKMAVAPRVPACPTDWAKPAKPAQPAKP
jgi:hypothetical protein